MRSIESFQYSARYRKVEQKIYVYIYIDPQEKIPTFKTVRHRSSSVIIDN